jgi:maleylacetate reductase
MNHDAYRGLPAGTFNIQAQEQVVFGQPADSAVVALAQQLGARRVFLTSSRSLARLSDGPLQQIARALGERHVGTMATIRAHSPREDVIDGARAARAAKADLLVAVGGGSVLDATKAMLMCLWMNLDSPESFEVYRNGTAPEIARKIVAPPDAIRMIAVSTTLSAADFTPNAGVTESVTHTKQSYSHRLMAPFAAVLDPAATLHTPPDLLFNTAIRSVDHAVESYCSPLANPATEPLSLQGLRLLYRALPAMQANPTALGPRLDAQFGMWQAIAGSVGGAKTGASHGIGYALGATFDIAHGHTSCILLPAVLQWNSAVNADRQRALSEAMGAPGTPAWELIRALVKQLNLPGTLRDVKIGPEHFEDLARRALVYVNLKDNPRQINRVEDVIEVLKLAA